MEEKGYEIVICVAAANRCADVLHQSMESFFSLCHNVDGRNLFWQCSLCLVRGLCKGSRVRRLSECAQEILGLFLSASELASLCFAVKCFADHVSWQKNKWMLRPLSVL